MKYASVKFWIGKNLLRPLTNICLAIFPCMIEKKFIRLSGFEMTAFAYVTRENWEWKQQGIFKMKYWIKYPKIAILWAEKLVLVFDELNESCKNLIS